MLSVYALGRLIWRPASLLMLFPLFLFAVTLSLATSPADLDSWRTFGRVEGLFHNLWSGAILGLALVGFLSTAYTSELRRGFFAWMLPGIDGHLLRGSIILELLFALPFAAAFTILIGPAAGIAALGTGFLFFAFGIEVANSLRGRGYRWALTAAIFVAVMSPDDWHRIATLSPTAFGILTGTIGAFILRRACSRQMARRQPFAVDVTFGLYGAEALRAYWAKGPGHPRQWQRALRHGSDIDWVAATVYESYNPRAGGWGRHVLVGAAIGCLFAYAINSPSLVGLSAGAGFVFGGLQLRMNAIYPLSRQQRARVFFLASLLDNVVISGLCALLIWSLYAFGPGHLRFLAGNETFSPPSAAAFAALVFMVAPVAQWARVGGPFRYQNLTPQRVWKPYAFMVVFLLLFTVFSFPLKDGGAESWVPWSAVPIVAIVVQSLYWLALQRYFSRADLVLTGS